MATNIPNFLHLSVEQVYPDNDGRKFLQIIGIHLPNYVVIVLKLWEAQI